MNKKERAKIVLKILNQYFPHPHIPLNHSDPYTLLIAVLLSAQCTDKRVNAITPSLFKLAGAPEKMTSLTITQIEELIHTCGLGPTKAKAIKNLSQILVEKYGGKVPRTFEELEALPGVGHKTASVVMVQAFKKPAFPVDTHIHRCAKRWGLSNGTSVEKTEEDLKKLFPQKDWGLLHLQIIYFAREYCTARSHMKAECPMCKELS